MTELFLTTTQREVLSKGASRDIRKEGKVPGIIYGGKGSIPIIIDKKELSPLLKAQLKGERLFNLKLKEKSGKSSEKLIMLKDLQYHPTTEQLLHVDLFEIDMNKKISLSVQVIAIGQSAGIKKGGILNSLMSEIKIECLPKYIPKEIEVDITDLEVGKPIHIFNVKVGENIKILEDPGNTVFTLVLPKEEVQEKKETDEPVVAAAQDKSAESTKK